MPTIPNFDDLGVLSWHFCTNNVEIWHAAMDPEFTPVPNFVRIAYEIAPFIPKIPNCEVLQP